MSTHCDYVISLLEPEPCLKKKKKEKKRGGDHRQKDKLLLCIQSLFLFCFSVVVCCITRNNLTCLVTSAVIAFCFQRIHFNDRVVYISHRFVMFSLTLYRILISYIVNKYLFKPTELAREIVTLSSEHRARSLDL